MPSRRTWSACALISGSQMLSGGRRSSVGLPSIGANWIPCHPSSTHQLGRTAPLRNGSPSTCLEETSAYPTHIGDRGSWPRWLDGYHGSIGADCSPTDRRVRQDHPHSGIGSGRWLPG